MPQKLPHGCEYSSRKLNMIKKIKILRIVSRLNIGGVSIHVAILSNKVDNKRFETSLVSGILSRDEGDMGYLFENLETPILVVPELQRKIHPLKDLIALIKLFIIMVNEKPDIVDTHTAKAGVLGRLAAWIYKLAGRKQLYIVHTFHGNVFEEYFGRAQSSMFKFIEKCMAFLSDVIIAISQAQKDELLDQHRIGDRKKVFIMKLGFDLKPFLQIEHIRGGFRKKWSLGADTFLIGIIGRLVPIKNHRIFLKAASIFISQNKHLAVKFLIVGDGELRNELQQYAIDLGIEDKVLFVGWEKDIKIVYADLDILALTSLNEGTPVSIIEAMAASVPVITTRVGGIKDLLGQQEENGGYPNGFAACQRGVVCLKNNATAFAAGLQFLLENENKNTSLRTKMARNYVIQNYSEDRVVREIQALYERLTANNDRTDQS
jgi:glycosyltransferase involved in cell wall biosynthesis